MPGPSRHLGTEAIATSRQDRAVDDGEGFFSTRTRAQPMTEHKTLIGTWQNLHFSVSCCRAALLSVMHYSRAHANA